MKMPNGIWILACVISAWWGMSCTTSDPGESKQYISLRVHDSLTLYDTLIVVRCLPTGKPIDTLWNAPLPSPGLLERIEAPHSSGGDVILWIRGIRGAHLAYSMWFEYELGTGKARSHSLLPPDTLAPAVIWTGRDTVEVAFWDPQFPQPELFGSAACLDDRDLTAPVPAVEFEDFQRPSGEMWVSFHCKDAGGNVSTRIVPVKILKARDRKPPHLWGVSDSVRIWPAGIPYHDSVICADEFDGRLTISVEGSIDVQTLGMQSLRYRCVDSSGNEAYGRRFVNVVPGGDILPEITYWGMDTVPLITLDSFKEPGPVECRDEISDTLLPVAISKPTADTGAGYYRIEYRCVSEFGGATVAKRVLRVGLIGTALYPIAETMIDSKTPRNYGGNGFLPLSEGLNDDWRTIPLVRFDLRGADKGRLKSAKLRLHTFILGGIPRGGYQVPEILAWRVKSNWNEGTGDKYYHGGLFHEGGAIVYANYPRPDSIRLRSSDPALGTGLAGEFSSWIASDSIVPVVQKRYRISFFEPGDRVPISGKFTVVELNVTEYIKTSDPDSDNGLFLKATDSRDDLHINFATKELGDGRWAPRLLLEY